MKERRVIIQWTETAKNCLAKLPLSIRRGLLEKARALRECDDPRRAHQRLQGPLQGYYRLTYSRYRAMYSVDEEEIANGDIIVYVKVRFVAAGIRKEGDKKDVYNFALRMLKLGALGDLDQEAIDDEDLEFDGE